MLCHVLMRPMQLLQPLLLLLVVSAVSTDLVSDIYVDHVIL